MTSFDWDFYLIIVLVYYETRSFVQPYMRPDHLHHWYVMTHMMSKVVLYGSAALFGFHGELFGADAGAPRGRRRRRRVVLHQAGEPPRRMEIRWPPPRPQDLGHLDENDPMLRLARLVEERRREHYIPDVTLAFVCRYVFVLFNIALVAVHVGVLVYYGRMTTDLEVVATPAPRGGGGGEDQQQLE